MAETILIVDDEESVQRTFREWLEGAGLECRILCAADAESALVQANQQTVDLAILDWNLGAGHDGLRLLEDLYLFNPGLVAVMVTGYAQQATPLDAMRMGVRDYLDKNQDLDRDTFLTVVRRQLETIRPAKRERLLHRTLLAFREAVDKVVPLARSAAALNDPVPLSEAVRSLFRFLMKLTQARDGVLFVRSYDPGRQPPELCRVYDAAGAAVSAELVPYARSVAGSAASLQQPCAMNRLAETGTLELQPFERGRQSLLAAPLAVAPGIQVVLELFDKQDSQGGLAEAGFTEEDRGLAATTAEFGVELLRQALAERQTHQLLLDAAAAALKASATISQSLAGAGGDSLQQPPATAVLDQLREGLRATPGRDFDPDLTLRLAEAIRVLTLKHGAPALKHCIHLVEDLRALLDEVTDPG